MKYKFLHNKLNNINKKRRMRCVSVEYTNVTERDKGHGQHGLIGMDKETAKTLQDCEWDSMRGALCRFVKNGLGRVAATATWLLLLQGSSIIACTTCFCYSVH
ncbi:Uncharacterized protein TCM_024249 [Theobroma cacao]|uniref:Uncharacterized protein n=1 Tax=Theobroma cacao TaxID=3641 RepID=A0A061EVV5_THECC|nr:Uncharacterized protein TCM_024249 [Theobroma cacao]